jgi:GTP-binding protein
MKTLAKVKQALLDYPGVTLQLFSSLKKTGCEQVEAVAAAWFDDYLNPQELCPPTED